MAGPTEQLTAGVDVGGTKIQTVVLRGQEVVGSARRETPQTGPDAVIAAVVDSVKASIASASARTADLAAIGIGMPGTIDADAGSVGHSPNVPGFETEPVAVGPAASRALGSVDVRIDNDVRAAILGEWKCGA